MGNTLVGDIKILMGEMNAKLGPDDTRRELIMRRGEAFGEMNENEELFAELLRLQSTSDWQQHIQTLRNGVILMQILPLIIISWPHVKHFKCLVCGFHNSLARSAMMHLSCEETLKSCHGSIVEMLNRNITALDLRQDKACFFKRNEQVYTRPGQFTFMPSKEDNEDKIRADGPLYDELQTTANQLMSSIETLRVSTDETWKTLEEVEKKLLELINQKDYDVSRLFCIEKPRSRRSLGGGGGASGGSSMGSIGAGSVTSSSSSTSPGAGSTINTTHSNQQVQLPWLIKPVEWSWWGWGGLPAQDVSSNTSQINQSVLSFGGNDPTQAGLYLSLRSLFRDARIEQEKFYLDRFSFYTQEMHICQLMQVKLAQIQNALASSQPAHHESTPHTSPSLQNLKSMLRHGIPVLPKLPGCKDFAKSPKSPTSINFYAKTDNSSSSPLPPPPTPYGLHQDVPSSPVIPSSPSFSSRTVSPNSQSVLVTKHQPRRVLRVPNVGKPKLFGGTIDEYVEATKQPIPCIILSCTRVINEFGMHQQGVFRVSGSQAEINEFKDAFENGDDPLIGIHEPRDINSTAGLLKLYFRELGEPPFPNTIFLELINITRERLELNEMIQRLRHVITQNLSRPVFVVMRYLFAFLNHVSEYSTENMMDAYNLAICFGPTLMPVPSEYNQVHYQPSVIDLIKTFIIHHSAIFDPILPGPVYSKQKRKKDVHKSVTSLDSHRLSLSSSNVVEISSDINGNKKKNKENDDHDHDLLRSSSVKKNSRITSRTPIESAVKRQSSTRVDSVHEKGIPSKECIKSSSVGDLIDNETSSKPASQVIDEGEPVGDDDYIFAEDTQSISDSEDSEPAYTLAVARADFTGSSERELSFRQGDEIYLYRQLSQHWWEGQLASDSQGTRGLIPHLYVVPKAALLHLAAAAAAAAATASTTCDNPGNTGDNQLLDEMNTEISKQTDSGSLSHLDNVDGDGDGDDDDDDVDNQEVDNKSVPDNGSMLSWNCASESSNEQILADTGDNTDNNNNNTNANNSKVQHLSESERTVVITNQSNKQETIETSKTNSENTTEKDMKSDNCSDNQISVPQTTESVDKKCLPEVGGYTDKLLMMHRFNQRSALSYPVCGPLGSVPENDVISASELMNQSSPTYNSNGVVGGGGRPSHSVVESGSSTRFLFNSDVDTALEEVMRGLASLEQADSRNSDSRTLERNQELTRKLCLPSAKHAPDLVMDLPVTSDSQVQNNTSTTSGFTHIESGDSFAEHFAEQNLDTMRKRSDVHVLPSSLASTRFPTGSSSTTSCGELGKVVLRSKTSHTTTPATTTEISRTSPGLSKGSPSEEKSDSPQTSNTELTSSSGPRLSIAARVAAFEGNKPDSPRSSINFAPKIAPKPKRG
uniref:SH3 domain-containing protein n=1 Tax=Trichobilharzia regenti TaxID=157069 RepID=A0AA85K3P6_TRIRE|nr:unnamed protein product [Trichobilharzia regenti]